MIIFSSVDLIQHPEYGECAIAQKDLSAGDIVIEETPLMTIDYKKDLLLDTIGKDLRYKRKRAFMTLSLPAKVSLSMAQQSELAETVKAKFHLPSITSSTVRKSMAYKAAIRGCKELRVRAQLFPEIARYEDTQLAEFSMLASANAHAFDSDSIAMLEVGCKVTHSCFTPNVAVSTRIRRNKDTDMIREDRLVVGKTVKHIALANIKKGDVLYGTYAKLTHQTVPERRRYLKDHKMFRCQCKHCLGLDKARGMKCTTCCDEVERDATQRPIPLSTMYLKKQSTAIKSWVCGNCKASTSTEEMERTLNATVSSEEVLREELQNLDEEAMSPSLKLATCQKLYLRALETFGWRHAHTASAALSFMDACSKVIDPSSSAEKDEIDLVLSSYETIPQRLEVWFTFLEISPMEELASLYLFSSEQLMTMSSLHHEYIPRSMDIVQALLLKVRPMIEQRRTWQIGHVLEEYYDEALQTLDALVNGNTGDGITEDETIQERNEEIAV